MQIVSTCSDNFGEKYWQQMKIHEHFGVKSNYDIVISIMLEL